MRPHRILTNHHRRVPRLRGSENLHDRITRTPKQKKGKNQKTHAKNHPRSDSDRRSRQNERSPTGTNWVMVEPDIDYYQDLGAHALLEVIPNAITKSLTDPAQVYVLRWIDGKTSGIPEFKPLYTIT
jgi:hypothetical protein